MRLVFVGGLALCLAGMSCASTDTQSDFDDSTVAAAQADAGATGNAAEGARLAEELCANCHVTPVRQPPADVGPPWADIADNPAATDDYLRDFLATPHWPIRRNILTPRQIDDIIAYIRSLGTAS